MKRTMTYMYFSTTDVTVKHLVTENKYRITELSKGKLQHINVFTQVS